MSGTFPPSYCRFLLWCSSTDIYLAYSRIDFFTASGFSGFAMAKNPASKPAVQSSLASKLPQPTTKSSIHAEDKHEALRKTTEAAQIGLRKEDVEAMNKALEEDPTVFEYGDFEEEFQPKLQSRKKPLTGNAKYGYGITIADSSRSTGSSSSAPQSKYIDNLLQKAREREAERDMVFERQQHKENMRYEELHGPTESFITPEYQAKLEEDARIRAEIERKDRKDASASNIGSFYTNLNRSIIAGSSSLPQDDNGGNNPTASSSSQTLADREAEGVPLPSGASRRDELAQQTPSSSMPSRAKDLEITQPTQPRQSLIAKSARKPRRHTEEMIESAKQRYLHRQQLRDQLASAVV